MGGTYHNAVYCTLRHTEQILNGTVLYDGRQGEGGRTFAFLRFGELTSA